jgi:hypothetical protein
VIVELHCFLADYLINGTNFGEDSLNRICVFLFFTSFVLNISHSDENLDFDANYSFSSQNSFTLEFVDRFPKS